MADNPFAAPSATMRADLPGPDASLATLAKAIFLQWEKLRVVYLVVLAGICLLLVVPTGLAGRGVVGTLVDGAIAANLLYFAGPAVETYVAWLGYRPAWLRVVLFIGGTLLSALLAVGTLIALVFPNQA